MLGHTAPQISANLVVVAPPKDGNEAFLTNMSTFVLELSKGPVSKHIGFVMGEGMEGETSPSSTWLSPGLPTCLIRGA